jgi:dinuclear metal center YbgI/SA1388 family protein
MKRRRLGTLLVSDTSLLAYHLPLDGHPQFGNNACLGQLLGLELSRQEPLQPGLAGSVGNIGSLPAAIPAGELVRKLEQLTGRSALHVGDAQASVQRIAWCTGGAQDYIDFAVAAQADIYITGEVSERTVHTAREEGVQFVAAGHHATERYGVQALGAYLADTFALEHHYFEVDNPA